MAAGSTISEDSKPIENTELLTIDTVLAAIPPFSPAVLKVMDLVAQPDAEMALLARAIGADATLSAEILKLANSALFGAESRIDSVQKAVVTLGHSWIQHVTLRAGTLAYARAAEQTEELKRSWRHTLATAALCRAIARVNGISPERAYTMGLLHDVGRLGLLAAFPRQFTAAVRRAEDEGVPLTEAEKAAFGIGHDELGRKLLEAWNLPAEFAKVAAEHHEDPSETCFDLLSVVQLACRLADGLGYSLVPPAAAWSLGMIREELPELARPRFPSDPEPLVEMIEEAIGDNGSLDLSDKAVETPAEQAAVPQPETIPLAAPEFRLSESKSAPWKMVFVPAATIAVAILFYLFR